MSMMQTTIEQEHMEPSPLGESGGTRLCFAADGDGTIPQPTPKGSVELVLEATNSDRETPFWLDDAWWMTAFRIWKDQTVIVRLLPTPGCLNNPVVLHQLNMLRRIVPQWRIIAAVHAHECPSGQTLQSGLPIDEIEVLPNSGSPARGPSSKTHRTTTTAKKARLKTDGQASPMPKLIYCDATPGWVGAFTTQATKEPATVS